MSTPNKHDHYYQYRRAAVSYEIMEPIVAGLERDIDKSFQGNYPSPETHIDRAYQRRGKRLEESLKAAQASKTKAEQEMMGALALAEIDYKNNAEALAQEAIKDAKAQQIEIDYQGDHAQNVQVRTRATLHTN
jgi:hypothetical protein